MAPQSLQLASPDFQCNCHLLQRYFSMQYNFYSFSLETRHLNWKDKTILWRNLARKKRKSNIWWNPTVWRHCARLLYLLACLSSVSVNKPFQRTLAQGKSWSKNLKFKIWNWTLQEIPTVWRIARLVDGLTVSLGQTWQPTPILPLSFSFPIFLTAD